MNVSKTVLTVFIALLAIGLSGIVAANGATSSTQQTFVGEGSYETSWNGNSGMMAIHTYTSNGNDHLNVDYHTGRTTGEQTGMTENGWTQVDREVSARGHDVKISANTFDNSNDMIEITTAAECGRVKLDQTTYTAESIPGYDIEGVASIHTVKARGRDTNVLIYTTTDETNTLIHLINDQGRSKINGIAVAGNGYGYEATGQYFKAKVHGDGEAYIIGSGESVGINMNVRNDNTHYSTTGNGMTYIELQDQFASRYSANGYIYAITPAY